MPRAEFQVPVFLPGNDRDWLKMESYTDIYDFPSKKQSLRTNGISSLSFDALVGYI